MTTTEPRPTELGPVEIGGIGHSVKRHEDARFIEGQGNYLDDIVLPGMLYMAILRSPVAHARINSIDTTAASEMDGVVAVVTGELMDQHGLAWMPTLSGDTQAVLATDKVRYQGQEVAAVIATDPYVALDATELIEVDYETLPPITTPQQALEPGAVVIRDEKEGQTDNLVYEWEAGDAAATEAAFARADRVVTLETHYPRSHPAPLETCGIVADVNSVTGQATLWLTSQAPHAHRTLFAMVAGLPEQDIRIISPDLGGGFGNKVPIYPGYVVATAASLLIGKPVKWIETRSENLISTGFARDYHMKGELAVTDDGKILALRVNMLSDQGAFYADAQPTKFKAGLFHVVTGSYDYPAAHIMCKGAFTNKAPGGVAYRCSFRITEASFLIERLVQNAAYDLGIDPADMRFKNFIQPEQFPYETPTGFVYDSGDYPTALRKALDEVGYEALRAEQLAARQEGRLIGIGLAHFTEAVGAGPSKTYDIAGLKMIDSAELRVHPTGKAILKLGVKSQGQGHETTFAQIVAEELGIPVTDIKVLEGDTDNTPYGLGTYASRSTPVGGAATAMVSRQLADKAKRIAAHLLEAADEDIELKAGQFSVRGTPDRSVTIQDVALAAYTNLPDGMEYGLEGVHYYDPPNLTYPYGSYVVVVEVDADTGVWKVQRMVALDDCGVRINPMIVEGQIHGGLTEGFAMSSMQWITFDDDGNCIGSNFMDYLIPTAWETPRFELLETHVPSPHHPIGAKGVGESATVGSPAAYVNAVIDAVAHLGVRNIDMPVLPDRVWAAIRDAQGWTPTMELDVLATAVALRERREPFALATVVWRRSPSSGHLGSKALILSDGTMQGWLGGACAQPTVVQEALAAMGDGRSRLLLLGQPDDLGVRPDDGILKVPMACESEGAMEIYLEPVLPAPQVLIIGRSPAVFTLAQLASDLEWDVTVIDDGGDPADHPRPEAVRTRLDVSGLGVGPATAIVVATQGHYDDLALEVALHTDAGYVGLVAAGKRASATLELLRRRGVPDDQLARVTAPAGLDLGRVSNAEIAVAVLAELVARRAAGTWGGGQTEVARMESRDPVCGMTVDPESSRYRSTRGDADHWFCSPGCLAEFERDPTAYLHT